MSRLLAGLTLLAAIPASAQIQPPDGAGRLVRTWDFEERERVLEPVPRNWFRSLHDPDSGAFRPGFPQYNLAVVDDEHAFSGNWSVKLPINGGSTSLMLARGVVPALPDGDVMVTAKVRTQNLVHARARMAGRLLDDQLQPIEGGFFTSDAIITGGAWRTVSFEMRGDPQAAWIQIELQVLQPAQLLPPPTLAEQIVPQDVRGAAWFDDVKIYRIPRVLLSTNDPGNVVFAPRTPTLVLRVQDLVGEPLLAELRVFAHDGTLVHQQDEPLDRSWRPVDWMLDLPAYGWYRGVVRLLGKRGPVGQTTCDFAWVPADQHPEPSARRRFGLVVESPTHPQLSDVPRLLMHAGTGSLWLDVWDAAEREREAAADGADPLDQRETRLDQVVEYLLEDGHDVTFVLERVPGDLARRANIDLDNPIRLLADAELPWLERIAPLLTRFGERIRRWQVGSTGSTSAFFEPDASKTADGVRQRFFRLIPRPTIVMPWGIEQSLHAQSEDFQALTVTVPHTTSPASLPEHVAGWPAETSVSLVLEPVPGEVFGFDATATDLAQRAVLAWSADADSLAIQSPWTWRSVRDGGPMPTVELPVWRTISSTLAGMQVVGELPVAPGVFAFIAQGAAAGPFGEPSGVLIAWNDSATREDAVLRGYLGRGPIVVHDIFGNERLVEPEDGEWRIALRETPIFIHGVDVRLLRFRAGLRIEPDFIETRAERHEVDVVIRNPWRTTITGRMRIAEPESWDVAPRVFHFSIAPEEERRVPLSIAFGIGEQAGARTVLTELVLSAEREYPLLMLPIRAELGLKGVELRGGYQTALNALGEATDLAVTLLITNRSDRPLSVEVFALAPGYAREEAAVSALEPGNTAIRRFRFAEGVRQLRGQQIRIGLRELDGNGLLNKWLDIE
jgi:hypothetical protein